MQQKWNLLPNSYKSSTVTEITWYGNQGRQWKVLQMTTLQNNSFLVHGIQYNNSTGYRWVPRWTSYRQYFLSDIERFSPISDHLSVWTSISDRLIRYTNLADIRLFQNPIFRIVERYGTIRYLPEEVSGISPLMYVAEYVDTYKYSNIGYR